MSFVPLKSICGIEIGKNPAYYQMKATELGCEIHSRPERDGKVHSLHIEPFDGLEVIWNGVNLIHLTYSEICKLDGFYYSSWADVFEVRENGLALYYNENGSLMNLVVSDSPLLDLGKTADEQVANAIKKFTKDAISDLEWFKSKTGKDPAVLILYANPDYPSFTTYIRSELDHKGVLNGPYPDSVEEGSFMGEGCTVDEWFRLHEALKGIDPWKEFYPQSASAVLNRLHEIGAIKIGYYQIFGENLLTKVCG